MDLFAQSVAKRAVEVLESIGESLSGISAGLSKDPDNHDVRQTVAGALGNVATWLKYLGNGDAGSSMGAIEHHAVMVKEAGDSISSALGELAAAITDGCSTIAAAMRKD